MKSLKSISLWVCLLSSCLIFAQRGPRPEVMSVEEMTEKQLENFDKKLTLDDLQKSLFKVHLTELNTNKKEILQSNGNQESKKEELQQLEQSYLPKFEDVLSPEQYQLFLEMKEEMKTRREQRGFNGRHRQRN